MKLGHDVGVLGPAAAARTSWGEPGGRAPRLRLHLDRRGVGLRRVHARWPGSRRHTERVRLGTGVVQLAARTPTATAMHAITLDHLSNGRLILGLGVSGPAGRRGLVRPAVEQAAGPHPRVRRDHPPGAAPARSRSSSTGEFFQHPYHGEGSIGLGKPLKPITHPLRREIPIFLGAEGPKNVTQTAEIADGWLPLYYSPYRQEVYADQLAGAKDGLRDHGHGHDGRHRRHRGRPGPGEGHARLLHRRHGGQGPELPHRS